MKISKPKSTQYVPLMVVRPHSFLQVLEDTRFVKHCFKSATSKKNSGVNRINDIIAFSKISQVIMRKRLTGLLQFITTIISLGKVL